MINTNLSKKFNYEIWEILCVLLISLGVGFLYSYTYLNEDNCNYAVEEMHAYDAQLFEDNISIIGSDYSPRYYANAIMVGLIRLLGCSWLGAAAVLIRINYILYALMVTYLTVKVIEKNRLLGCLILNICIMSGASLVSLGFGINGAEDVFLGTAIPIALSSIVCVIGKKKNWAGAWVLSALAGFLHVHEGMWAGCVVGFIWLSKCIADRRIDWKALVALPIYIVSILLIVVPSLTHTSPVDESYFNEIYVFIRTPHHLLLSSWGERQILVSIFLLAVPAWIIIKGNWKQRSQKEVRRTIALIASMGFLYLLLLLVQYIATEIVPISTIVTMYLPKCFKYITFLGIIAYVKIGLSHFDKNRFIQGCTLLFVPLLPNLATSNLYLMAALLCIGVYILCDKFDLNNKLLVIEEVGSTTAIRIFSYISIMCFIDILHVSLNRTIILIYAAILLYEFLNAYIKIKRLGMLIIITFLIGNLLYSIDGKVFEIDRSGIKYISGTTYAKNGAGDTVYDLANQFKNMTDVDTEYLADPYSDESNYFQMISQRTCYCLYKNMPSNKSAVIDWYERILKVKAMTTCSAAELKKLLHDINLEYVLVTPDRYEVLEGSGLFEEVVKNETMAMYRLK